MEFNPNNDVVKLCLAGMRMEDSDNLEQASNLFNQALNAATDGFEKFLATYFTGKHQSNPSDKLKWFEKSLHFALQINDESVRSAFPSLYANIAKCHEELNQPDEAKKHSELSALCMNIPLDKGPFYHGTKSDLKVGNLLTAGGISNYKTGLKMNHIYFTALSNGAALAAALAKGDGQERVYRIEPTGSFENDPNVTDKKFPGNLTRSYRSTEPLKIVGEVTGWERLVSEEVMEWKRKLANSKGEIIN